MQTLFYLWKWKWPNYYWPDANIHTNTATGNTQRRHEPKVTRIIVSSPAVVQQGWYLSPWCHETCEKRVWLFLDIFSTPVPRVQWVGISNFITCHKRDTGCSGEHCSLSPTPPPPPPSTHPLARHHTRPWKSCSEKEDKDFPSGRLQPRPADVHIVFWLLIDLRAVKSSWSHKARRCRFIYPSTFVNPQLDAMYSKWCIQWECSQHTTCWTIFHVFVLPLLYMCKWKKIKQKMCSFTHCLL